MNENNNDEVRTGDLPALSQTGRGTPMGTLLRGFWQPVAQSSDVAPGKARAIRRFGEDLTLYRGEAGHAHLVGGFCPHRLTRLHTGWVEGEEVRCVYHGWKFDGTGQCTEMPAEREGLCKTVSVDGYPVHEYCGLIFAYMGDGEAPVFDLPRKDVFEMPDRLYFTRDQVWPCNWLQQVENSLDATHVSFVHMKGRVGRFGNAVTPAIPELDYSETESGIRQVADRGEGNIRVSDWTFPNNNHILIPSIQGDDRWIDIAIWLVPVDDYSTTRQQIYSVPKLNGEADRMIAEHFAKHVTYNPADHHDRLFVDDEFPEETLLELTSAQDYVAAVGQGAIVDRAAERLGASDAGIAILRRILLREMHQIQAGAPTKHWRKRDHAEALQVPDEAGVA
jgi:5,5'-dehydrodivanillate O-demethylase